MEKIRATCAIITNEQNQILLIKRGREPFLGHWALISGIGATKKGLPPEKAVIDEVKCDLQTLFFEHKLLFTLPVLNDNFVNEVSVFIGKVAESKIIMHPPFSLEYKWFSPNEIRNMAPLAFSHNKIIEKFLKQII